MPQWSRIPSVTGLERAQEVVRELCLGEAGQIPAYYQSAELLSLLDLADAPRLLAGSSPAWQALLLEHFALQALLDAEPDEGWPLATLVASCSPALSGQIQARAQEWEWLCGPFGGEVTTHWPALQQLAQQGDEQPLAERLLGALGQWQGQEASPWPRMFSALLWLGWLQQADPVQGSEQRKKWQRSLGNHSPCWPICWGSGPVIATARRSACSIPCNCRWRSSTGVTSGSISAPWRATASRAPGDHLAQVGPLPRAGRRAPASPDGLLPGSAATPAGPGGRPLAPLRLRPAQGEEEDATEGGRQGPASASWLNWLQGLGRSSGVRKPQERLVWLLHAGGA